MGEVEWGKFVAKSGENPLQIEIEGRGYGGDERRKKMKQREKVNVVNRGLTGIKRKKGGVSRKLPKYPSFTLFLCPKLMHIQYR